MSKKGISNAGYLLLEQYEYPKIPDKRRIKHGHKGVAGTK
jgi:hypothetical protein